METNYTYARVIIDYAIGIFTKMKVRMATKALMAPKVAMA
jgi:hypothetical protein